MPFTTCNNELSQQDGNRLLLVCFVVIFTLTYCVQVLYQKICLREGKIMSAKCEVNLFASKVLHVVK